MLLESNGITINNYYIPPFWVSKGEVDTLIKTPAFIPLTATGEKHCAFT